MAKLLEDLLGANGVDVSPMKDLAHALVTGGRVSGKSREFLSFVMAGRSGAEMQWRSVGGAILETEVGSSVVWVGYEWITFRVPAGKYTPDFMYIFENGEIAFVEVKGTKKQRGYVSTRQKLRAVATLNPWFRFFEAVGGRMAWEVERIKPEVGFLQNIIDVCEE